MPPFIKAALKVILGRHLVRQLSILMTALRVLLAKTMALSTNKNFRETSTCPLTRFTSPQFLYFFGYYDLVPYSPDEQRLLTHRIAKTGINQLCDVGYFELNRPDPEFIRINTSPTWCWQLGTRLQWHTPTSILFNTMEQDRAVAMVQNIHSKQIEQIFCNPLYAIDKSNSWGLTLNFSRLQRLRPGYGYSVLPDVTQDELAPSADGIWLMDLAKNSASLIISLEQISRFEPHPSMSGAEHYFNHLHFNENATRFLFFHIWLKNEKRFTRLLTCSREGQDLFPLINEGHVSHYTWLTNSTLIAYATHAGTGTETGFYQYKDQTTERKIIGKNILTKDGHPSISQDRKFLLCDTYPDKTRRQQLFIFDLTAQKKISLGCYYSPQKFAGESKCDLHPRWSPSNRQICFDSAHTGTRGLYNLDFRGGIGRM